MTESVFAAAIAKLEAEKQSRLQAKIDAGRVVRVPPLSILVGDPESVPAATEAFKARLRETGETREIYFEEPAVLVTGVPRRGRDPERPLEY